MGGGVMWSRVARLATTVPPAVRTAPPSASSCNFCRLNPSAQAANHASSSNMHSCACSPETTPGAVDVSQRVKSMWESDEWKFAEDEERMDHLVFGQPPSQQEVEEASTCLQDAFRVGVLAPAFDDSQAPTWGNLLPLAATHAQSTWQSSGSDDSDDSGGSTVTEEGNAEEMSRREPAPHELDWIEPPPFHTSQNALRARGRSHAQEALYQLQNNPEVQGMMISLARDPNIWNAVVTNRAVMEFRHRSQGGNELLGDSTTSVSVEGNGSNSRDTPGLFKRWQMYWRTKILSFVDVVSGLMNSMFGGADGEASKEEAGFFGGLTVDRSVKYATMLALLILLIVILRRRPA